MISQDFLHTLATEHCVSNSEFKVLHLAINGSSTSEVAQKLKVSEDVVRKRLSEIYRKFNIPGTGPVKLGKLQQLLVSSYQKYLAENQSNSSSSPGESRQQDVKAHQIWDGAPDISTFYGRTEELATLQQWIVQDKCRVAALVGMGGIGKTYLSIKLAQQIQQHFEYIIWQSLDHNPPIQEILANLNEILSYSQNRDLPESLEQKVSYLIRYLREHHVLLILDGFEVILDSRDAIWRHSDKWSGYRILLRRLGEEYHQSCVLLNSIEKPREIALLESPTGCVRSFELKGLQPDAAQKILEDKGLRGKQQWFDLIQTYQGNPLALKIAAATIQEIFSGNIGEFLKYESLVACDLFREILDWQFKRLSNSEKELIHSLAKEPNPISFKKLQVVMQPMMISSNLITALESLRWRSLIDKVKSEEKTITETLFSLHPVVKSYVNSLTRPDSS